MEELINLLCNLGYTKEESKEILNTYSLNAYKPETLKKKIEEINIYMKKLGYSKKEVIKMPAIYSYSIDNIKQKIEDMKKLGYSKKEVIKMTKSLPAIYGYSIDNIKKKIEDMKKLGYSKEEVIKMTKSLPSIYCLSIDNIKKKIEDMEELGYSKAEVIKITKSMPSLYGYSIDTLKQKIEDMEKLGYSRAEVIKMTKSLPAIYGYNIDNIKQKIEDMEKLGYSRAEVIKMTKSLPAIYGLSIDNIKQKIDFYDSIGLHELAINDTKKLMQSVSLSYARYMFYKEKNIEITDKSYNKLFINQKQFQKAYGITKEELLEKYDYQAYIQQKKTQDLGKETLGIQKDTPYIQQTEHAMNNQKQMLEQKNQDGINID